ncbi:MAG: LamG-like jellyroll fold domain-containing protein, partial [Planctomycetota bacterium]
QGLDRRPAKITSTPPKVAVAEAPYTYAVRADGRPPPKVTFTGLPEWLVFDGRRTVRGTPTKVIMGTETGPISTRAKNDQGESSQEFKISVREAAPGLVGWWTFDEKGGARDLSGRGNHGRLGYDARCLPAAGVGKGGGLLLDGSYDVVTVPKPAGLSFSKGLTMAAWFRHADVKWPGDRTLVSKLGACRLGVCDNGGALFLFLRDDRDRRPVKVPYKFEGKKWYHVAVAADPALSEARFHVNGSWVGTTATPVSRVRSARSELYIGSRRVHDREFKGALDDVRLYDRAIGRGELLAAYHAGAGKSAPSIAAEVPTSASAGVPYSLMIDAGGKPLPKLTVTGLPGWLKFDGKGLISGTPGDDVAPGATGRIEVVASNGAGPDAKTSFRVSLRAHDLTRGLVGRWSFDELTGVRDLSGMKNHGRLFNDARIEPVKGRAGAALLLDGHYDAVRVPGPPGVTVSGGLTVAAWFRHADGQWSGDRTIVSKPGAYRLWIGGGGKALVLSLPGIKYRLSAQAAYTFKSRQWYHVAASVDLEAAAVRFYVNGAAAGTGSIPAAATRISDKKGELFIGSAKVHASEFKGLIDDVRVYSRALSTAEVRAIRYERAGPAAPKIVTTPPRKALVGRRYDYRIEAAGNPAPKLTVRKLPEWLSYDGRYTVGGTPMERDVGKTSKIVVSAKNDVATDTREFEIEVVKTDPALHGWWRFDDGAGARALDSSGKGLDGTVVGGAKWVKGRLGGALEFDGKDDRVKLPQGFADLGEGFTVAMWVLPKAAKRWARFIELGNGTPEDNVVMARSERTETLHFRTYVGTKAEKG